ncbi:hypothetical protein ACHQM5_019210 [Ranunculus cassubicifolius]
MESNIESHSPDNADKGAAFRKPSNDKGNRKYRRHSSGSGSDSPSLDDRAQVLEGKRKNNERELGMESGRDRYEKGGDIHRHSDRRSYRSSHDHRRHDDYDKYHKRADEGDRSYNRSSGYGRESSSGTHSDRNRQGSDYDRSGDYRRSRDKYSREGSDGEGKDKDREEKRRHKDKDYDTERVTSERRRKSSYADDSNSSRDDKRNYGKSLEDRKSEKTHASEESTNHGRHSSASAEKESGGSRLGDTHKGSIKDIGREKGDIMEKRKHDNREGHIERFARDTDSKDYSTSTTRKSYGRSEDNSTRSHHDKESSPKKCKLLTGYKDKDNGKEGQTLSQSAEDETLPPRPKLPRETSDKVIPEPAQPLNQAEASHDFNAAKVAALKAAEAVNRNLVGGNYMSTDQKKKLLWGGKKTTPAPESGSRWEVPLFTDRERQEKFNKLMGVKGEVKTLEQKSDGLDPAEKQDQLQLELEKQYTAGLRRRDGRTVGLGL